MIEFAEVNSMGLRHLWEDREVDILVKAYANVHKMNQSKFFTNKDWAYILNEVNEHNVQKFNKKDIKQIKNKIDALIKTHKKEQIKQKRFGIPSMWKYFDTMEEIHRKKYENYHPILTSECKFSFNYKSLSVLDITENNGQTDEEEESNENEFKGQQLCGWENYSQKNMKLLELISKITPNSDEFIENVERMFTEPIVDIETLHSLFPNL